MLAYLPLHPLPSALAPPNPLVRKLAIMNEGRPLRSSVDGSEERMAKRRRGEPTPGLVNKKRVRYQGPAAQLREWFLRYTRDWILNDSQDGVFEFTFTCPVAFFGVAPAVPQAFVLRSVRPPVRPHRKSFPHYGPSLAYVKAKDVVADIKACKKRRLHRDRQRKARTLGAQKPDRAQAILCDATEEETVDRMAVVDEDVTMSTATDLQLEDARDMLSSLTLNEADDVPMAYEENPAAGVEPPKSAAASVPVHKACPHVQAVPQPMAFTLPPPAAINAAKPVIVPDEPKTAAAAEEPKANVVVEGPKATTPVVQKPKVVVVVVIVDKPNSDTVEETKANTVLEEPQVVAATQEPEAAAANEPHVAAAAGEPQPAAAEETPTVAATGDPVANEPSASTAYSFKPAAAIPRSTSVLSDLTVADVDTTVDNSSGSSNSSLTSADLYACGGWSGDNWDVLATSTPPRGACTPLHQLMASLTLCDAPESDVASLAGAEADVFGPKLSAKATSGVASSCSWEASMSFTQVISSLASSSATSSHRPAIGSSAGASSSSSPPQVQEAEEEGTKAEVDDDIWYETVEVMVGIVEEVEDEDEVWHDASEVFDDVVVEVL
ncbi:uncharacterized protein BXZ73DRAFT_101626 [Epithele typhae]|uniref:uncharacterized protein n=1 Tax=Epithele typhae TaxID=378194 RepID=UPI0020088837|nr:uncharacterized protein BXZ73DRAFT_101626 [Epithele typhae]KAH9931720.1 hypothetical protein BXZ73DRAFT_101626 [Epithele typhae]